MGVTRVQRASTPAPPERLPLPRVLNVVPVVGLRQQQVLVRPVEVASFAAQTWPQTRHNACRALEDRFQMQVRHNARPATLAFILPRRNARHARQIHTRHNRAHQVLIVSATVVLPDPMAAHVKHVLLETTKALVEVRDAGLVMK